MVGFRPLLEGFSPSPFYWDGFYLDPGSTFCPRLLDLEPRPPENWPPFHHPALAMPPLAGLGSSEARRRQGRSHSALQGGEASKRGPCATLRGGQSFLGARATATRGLRGENRSKHPPTHWTLADQMGALFFGTHVGAWF